MATSAANRTVEDYQRLIEESAKEREETIASSRAVFFYQNPDAKEDDFSNSKLYKLAVETFDKNEKDLQEQLEARKKKKPRRVVNPTKKGRAPAKRKNTKSKNKSTAANRGKRNTGTKRKASNPRVTKTNKNGVSNAKKRTKTKEVKTSQSEVVADNELGSTKDEGIQPTAGVLQSLVNDEDPGPVPNQPTTQEDTPLPLTATDKELVSAKEEDTKPPADVLQSLDNDPDPSTGPSQPTTKDEEAATITDNAGGAKLVCTEKNAEDSDKVKLEEDVGRDEKLKHPCEGGRETSSEQDVEHLEGEEAEPDKTTEQPDVSKNPEQIPDLKGPEVINEAGVTMEHIGMEPKSPEKGTNKEETIEPPVEKEEKQMVEKVVDVENADKATIEKANYAQQSPVKMEAEEKQDLAKNLDSENTEDGGTESQELAEKKVKKEPEAEDTPVGQAKKDVVAVEAEDKPSDHGQVKREEDDAMASTPRLTVQVAVAIESEPFVGKVHEKANLVKLDDTVQLSKTKDITSPSRKRGPQESSCVIKPSPKQQKTKIDVANKKEIYRGHPSKAPEKLKEMEGNWPKGWEVQIVQRQDGSPHDSYFTSPGGNKFRSLPIVKKFVKAVRMCKGNEDEAFDRYLSGQL